VAVHRTTVRLSEPGLAGSYVVAERRADGSLLLQPEQIEDVIDEFAGRVLSEEEQEQMFGRLDAIADADSK
jgi:hypothetical protein